MNAELLRAAKQLDIAERVELVEAIWDSISIDADAGELPVSQAHRQILDERLAEVERNPGAGSTWDEVRARLEHDR